MPNRPSATADRPGGVCIEGLEFIEIAATDPQPLAALLGQLGFRATAKHRSKDVTRYQQGDINLIVNATPGSFAQAFAQAHGPSICALALRVPDATRAYQALLDQGAWEATTSAGAMELNIPAIESIGGTQIYLVDRYGEDLSIYDVDFRPLDETASETPALVRIAGLTLSVGAGRSAEWRDFFCRLFGFQDGGSGRIRSPDGGFEMAFSETGASGFDQKDEAVAAVTLAAADPAGLRRTLERAGLAPQPMPNGGFSLNATPAGVEIIIGH